jgi:integrase
MKFSAKHIENLKPLSGRFELWEDDPAPGLFGVRVSPSGGVSWQFKYFMGGKQRRATIGRYRKNIAAEIEMTLAQARVRCAEMRRDVAAGINPGAAIVAERKAHREAETVEELVEAHLKAHVSQLRSAAEVERCLRCAEVRALYPMKARDVTRRNLSDTLNLILERAPYSANRTYSYLRKMFGWAVSNGWLEDNPVAKMEKPFKQEKSRERFLTDEEIARFWRGLDSMGTAPVIKDVLRLLLLTGARRGEVVGMAWSEIKDDAWHLPAARTKSKKPRTIPLCPPALDIIRRQPHKDDFVFSNPRNGSKLDDRSIGRALRRNLDTLGIEDLRLHDLRRSAATALQRLGIDYMVIQQILGHSVPGITAVYARHDYSKEMREALDRLASHIQALASDAPLAEVVAL